MKLSKRMKAFFRGYDRDKGHIVPKQLENQWLGDVALLEDEMDGLQRVNERLRNALVAYGLGVASYDKTRE